jgi:hypothetical protein
MGSGMVVQITGLRVVHAGENALHREPDLVPFLLLLSIQGPAFAIAQCIELGVLAKDIYNRAAGWDHGNLLATGMYGKIYSNCWVANCGLEASALKPLKIRALIRKSKKLNAVEVADAMGSSGYLGLIWGLKPTLRRDPCRFFPTGGSQKCHLTKKQSSRRVFFSADEKIG